MRALTLVLTVLLCAACGSTASKSGGTDPVTAAAAKTRERGATYTVAIDFSKVSKTGGKYDGSGAFDGNGNFTLNVIYKGMPIHAVAAINSANHVIVYMKSVAFAGQLPEDKTWVAADMTRLVAGSSTKGLDAVESPGSDPTQVLGWLAHASSGARKVGDGTVAGAHVVRYRVTLDLAKAAKEPGVAGPEAAQLQRTAKAPRIPVDVSVDDGGYVRAIDEHIRVKGLVAFRFPQLGAQQTIAAPPQSDVFDVTDQIPSS